MNVLDAIASATQVVSSIMLTVNALERASRDMHQAPSRIEALEASVSDLDNLTQLIRKKHAQGMHNTRLENQVRSLNALVEGLQHNLLKAKKMVTKNKSKRLARIMWSAMVGDPLSKVMQLVRDDLNCWLELQTLTDGVGQVVLSTAKSVSLLRINSVHGYPLSSKNTYVRSLLEQEDTHRVILIVGLSGIGKSCLARQIAADPPSQFVDGAAELSFGQGCTLSACNQNRTEYHKRLAKRISMFLVKIGFMKKVTGEFSDLEDVCCALQTALVGKSILILLDDVWEQDIVERFVKLYDNDCKYLVTTRNEAIYEITEAEKVEICKDDMREISKEILLYHSLLTIEELPSVAEILLDRCGHHPLTLAVMGKALRKEMRTEKWDKAIVNLSTYATSWPGPVSYVNEKEAETLTIFRSFEFSLEAMPIECQMFFIALASVAWAEPVPEACLEALWSVLGDENMFPLVVCKLVEGSLLIKHNSTFLYHVHDMVSLYFDNKTNEAIEIILKEASQDSVASIAPWLFVFGKESTQLVAENKMNSFLSDMHETLIMDILQSIINALMASKSISELEASRRSFHRLLGPRVTELILTGSDDQVIATSEAINIIFVQEDYYEFAQSVEDEGALSRLINLSLDCEDASSMTIVSALIAKLAEYGSTSTADIVLAAIPMDQLSELLSPDNGYWHESIFETLMSLIKVGKSNAVQRMISAGVDEKLLTLLESTSEVVQHYSIVILKSFHELGFPLQEGCLRSGTLNLLPWHARLSLERFISADTCMISSPTPQPFQDLLQKLIERDTKEIMKAIQDLLPIIEKASQPRIHDMILGSQLFERLAFLLQIGDIEWNRVRSECAFLVMKLACIGGKPFVQKFIEHDIVNVLVKMMHVNNEELQDSSYTALHQIVSGRGGAQIVNKIFKADLIEKLVSFLDHKPQKTKEVTMLLLVDLVEVGDKRCIEKMFSSQVVEKLVNMEKSGGKFSGSIVKFLKGLDMCKNISSAERQVMKQQVCSEVKKAVKSPKLLVRLINSIETSNSEGSKGSSSGKHRSTGLIEIPIELLEALHVIFVHNKDIRRFCSNLGTGSVPNEIFAEHPVFEEFIQYYLMLDHGFLRDK